MPDASRQSTRYPYVDELPENSHGKVLKRERGKAELTTVQTHRRFR